MLFATISTTYTASTLPRKLMKGFRLQIRTTTTQHETDDLLLKRKKWFYYKAQLIDELTEDTTVWK